MSNTLKEEKILLEVGKGYIKNIQSIVQKISIMREKINFIYNISIPMIRIIDNEKISKNGYLIIVYGKVKCIRIVKILKTSRLIKDIEKIIIENMVEICS